MKFDRAEKVYRVWMFLDIMNTLDIVHYISYSEIMDCYK